MRPARITPSVSTLTIRALTICALTIAAVGAGSMHVPAAGAATVRAQEVTFATPDEAAALELVNQVRQSRGLQPLVMSATLNRLAQVWAQGLVDAGKLSHDPSLGSDPRTDWERLGENVGRGGSLDLIEDGFEASPTHLANLLDPGFDSLGVAVVHTASGTVYVVQRFQETVPNVAPGTARAISATAPAKFAARTKVRRTR